MYNGMNRSDVTVILIYLLSLLGFTLYRKLLEEIKSNQEEKQPEGLVKNFNLILELNSNLEKVNPVTFSSLVRSSPHPAPCSECCSHTTLPLISPLVYRSYSYIKKYQMTLYNS
jgi:hypothetical protein